jgi:uncharacterized protein YaeQ
VALTATRLEFRVALANVPRGIDREDNVLVAQHPSETREHVVLRMLAWCLLHEERLAFGPGISSPEAADLWTHDLTGRVTTWVECGTARGDDVKRAMQHHTGAAVHAVLASTRKRDELLAEIAGWKKLPRGATLTVWTIDAALVAALAKSEARREKWRVTVLDEHLYVETDTATVDGPVHRHDAAGTDQG